MMAKKKAKKVRIQLVRSVIGRLPEQRRTVKALGLKKMNSTVEHEMTPAVMGMVNAVIPHAELEQTAYQWAQEILAKSPISIKMLKFAMNLTDDGMVGQQVFAGEATRLAYMTDEAKEGRDAFLEKRKPNFNKKWLP